MARVGHPYWFRLRVWDDGIGIAMSLVVMKFGGTSVEDATAIGRTAGIVAGRVAAGKKPVVVVSAMSKVTDQLLACAAAASHSGRAPCGARWELGRSAGGIAWTSTRPRP